MFRLRNYIALPLGFSTAIAFLIFNFPAGEAALSLLLCLLGIGFALDWVLYKYVYRGLMDDRGLYFRVFDVKVLSGFSIILLLFCLSDLYINGVALLYPESYADLSPIGIDVRHISNMSWVFVVMSFVEGRKRLSFAWRLCGFIFPVLFVDRNRLLQAIFCYGFMRFYSPSKKSGSADIIYFIILLLLITAIFLAIGFYRSGESAFIVESSGTSLVDGYFPLINAYGNISPIFQQLLLYISSPIFNFIMLFDFNYSDQMVLIRQTIPFLGGVGEIKDLPLLVPRFNVASEFSPFLLFGGPVAVVLGYIFEVLACGFSLFVFLRTKNLFSLLVTLRFLYCAFMMGFAPQFYTYTNYGFVLVCIILWFYSRVMRLLLLAKKTPLITKVSG